MNNKKKQLIYLRVFIDLVLASRGEIVALLDLFRPDALSDSDHPKELIDVVSTDTTETKHISDKRTESV